MRGGPPARDGSRIRHRARGPVGNGPPARDDSLNCPAQAVARLHRQHLSRPQHRAPDRCDVPLRARTRLRIRVHPAAARRRGGVAYNRTSTRPRARGQEDAFERPRKRHRPFGSERIAHQDGKGDGHQVLHARSAEESHRASSRRATQAALTASLLGHSEQGLSQAHELSLVKRFSAPRDIDFCRVE